MSVVRFRPWPPQAVWHAHVATWLTKACFSVKIQSCFSGNSSVGRAQPCQGWGREFESRFPLQFLFARLGGKPFSCVLAGWQSGDAAACKAVYAGSIPAPASKYARVAESVDATDLKSVENRFSCRFESGSGHQSNQKRQGHEQTFCLLRRLKIRRKPFRLRNTRSILLRRCLRCDGCYDHRLARSSVVILQVLLGGGFNF